MPVYAFEAKGIQPYILEGGKLRDIVGASEIVHRLAEAEGDDLVAAVRDAVEGGERIRFSRRAGGAFTAYAADAAPLRALRALFTLAIAHRAPGLPYIDALVEAGGFAEGLKALPAALQAARARPAADLPGLSPAIMAAPRTGRPAVARDRRRGGEFVDAATQAKRAAFDALRARDALAGVEARFLPPHLHGRAAFPVAFPEDEAQGDGSQDAATDASGRGAVFPMLRGRSTVALVHADGNRLGATLIAMVEALHAAGSDTAADFLRDFSRTVAEATEAAVQQAVETVAWDAGAEAGGRRVLPLRPIVLGGDDLGLIVRGDLALPFVSEYLSAFRRRTEAAFGPFRARYATDPDPAVRRAADAVPRGLSAGAGVAFVGKNHPFIAAHALAEDLARHAKDAAKAEAAAQGKAPTGEAAIPPSLVSFHRVTTALGTDWKDVLEHDLTAVEGGRALRLTLAPYAVTQVTGPEAPGARFPDLRDLLSFVACLDEPDLPVGPIRQTVGSLRTAPHEARRIYARWCAVMARTQARRDAFTTYARSLGRLGADARDLGCRPAREAQAGAGAWRATPLLDALAVRAAMRGEVDA